MKNSKIAQRLITVCLLAVLPYSSLSFAESREKEAAALIGRAKQLSDIRADGAPAFRLKMNFKTFRENGSVVEGTYTETWVSKDRWRRDTVASEFSRTEVLAEGTRILLESGKGLPDAVRDLPSLANVGRLHPESWKPEMISNRKLGGSDLRCVETAGGVRPGPHFSLEREHQNESEMPALCFDQNNGLLKAQIEPFFLVDHVVNAGCFSYDYEAFRDRMVARSYQCIKPGQPVIEAKIAELVALPAALDPGFFTLPGGVKEKNDCADPIKPPKAVYQPPALSRESGLVLVAALIGIDGEPRDLSLRNAVTQRLREPVLESVSHWRFRPATCDGEPVEQKIEIQVRVEIR